LLDICGMKAELEDALDTTVDLVEYECIRPELRDKVLAEEVRIL